MADSDADDWNAELESEVSSTGVGSLIVYSRDWTVETVLSQIKKNNIDLNPAFQRRNAWNDIKRSKLIESLILGIPVPEVVLAEDPKLKKSFIVIDGKQRLLALAGFHDPDTYGVWDSPKLKGLGTRKDLNNKSFAGLDIDDATGADIRSLMNADIRCTIISNYASQQVLYDIFYRLNTGSVPLSSQELRQVLNRGEFANFLISETNANLPLHKVLKLSGPDSRLRDAEILLRYICFYLYGKDYTGNLTAFLDSKMSFINENWDTMGEEIREITDGFNQATEDLICALTAQKVGRKFNDSWEGRFNRALFEVQVYYAAKLPQNLLRNNKEKFMESFELLSCRDRAFNASIEASTKTNENYFIRFELFREALNNAFGLQIADMPVPQR
jgi:hypothetical protein